jgi:hypothetical protein
VPTNDAYDELVAAAIAAPVNGWSFGWLDGRATGSQPTWSYPDLAHRLLRDRRRVLDIDTGGGEFLASLAPLPQHTRATESWPPNIPIRTAGRLDIHTHRFMIQARLPPGPTPRPLQDVAPKSTALVSTVPAVRPGAVW